MDLDNELFHTNKIVSINVQMFGDYHNNAVLFESLCEEKYDEKCMPKNLRVPTNKEYWSHSHSPLDTIWTRYNIEVEKYSM